MSRLVHGRDAQVRRLHLPNLARVEPHVALHGVGVVLEVAPRRLDHRRSQTFRQLHQLLVREPGADLADGLQLFGFLVVTREQVRAVDARTLASAVKRADGDEVEGVAASLEVILLELQPVERSLGGLVRGVHRLDDEALGVVGDGILEENLELLDVARDLRRAKVKLVGNLLERRVHRLPSLRQRLLQQRLAVEIEAVERVYAHVDFDVRLVDVLAPARGQNLKRKNLVVFPVVRHRLSIDHDALHALLQVRGQRADDVRELWGVVLLVPGEDLDGAVLQQVDLRAFPVVLVLARKLDV